MGRLLETRLLPLLARRIVFMVPLLFGVVTITFFVTRIAGGDPAYQIAGQFADPEVIAGIQKQLGTDAPLGEQYVRYLGDAVTLDFGESIFTGNTVARDLADKLPITLELIVFALVFALIVGIGSGMFAARRKGKAGDRAVNGISFFFLSLPDFWLGIILLYVFFYKLGWAPGANGQMGNDDHGLEHVTGAAVWDAIFTGNPAALKTAVGHVALPTITLGLLLAAPISRLTRSAMLEVLDADYIRFGRACGLPLSRLRRYALRASLPPVVTLTGILFTVLLGGAVLVEVVFSWQGAAQYAANAIGQSDYPAVQGFVLASGAISVFAFLVVDLLYVAIDPRVKL